MPGFIPYIKNQPIGEPVPWTERELEAIERTLASMMNSNGTGYSAKIDVYSTPGTTAWTKPADAVAFFVIVVGAGGGGCGGCTTLGTSGGGGGGGCYVDVVLYASQVPSSVSVTVGTGGVGGVGTTGATPPPGTAGGSSSFGSIITAPGGGGGGAAATVGGGGTIFAAGGTAVSTTDADSVNPYAGAFGGRGSYNEGAVAGHNAPKAAYGCQGGGGAGVCNDGTSAYTNGGSSFVWSTWASVAGGTSGGDGATVSGIAASFRGAGGGGGGGSASRRGAGGAGQQPGGGGGAGVSWGSGTIGANGGKGGDGIVVIVTHF